MKRNFDIALLRGRMARSKIGSALLNYLNEGGVTLIANDKCEGAYYADRRIFFNPQRDDDTVFSYIAHEARHAMQDSRGFFNGVMFGSLEDIVIRYRVIEADAYAFQSVFSYAHMKETRDAGPWNKLKELYPYFAAACEKAETDAPGDMPAMRRAVFFETFRQTNMMQGYDSDILDLYEKNAHCVPGFSILRLRYARHPLMADEVRRFGELDALLDREDQNYLASVASENLLSSSVLGVFTRETTLRLARLSLSEKRPEPTPSYAFEDI